MRIDLSCYFYFLFVKQFVHYFRRFSLSLTWYEKGNVVSGSSSKFVIKWAHTKQHFCFVKQLEIKTENMQNFYLRLSFIFHPSYSKSTYHRNDILRAYKIYCFIQRKYNCNNYSHRHKRVNHNGSLPILLPEIP